MIDGTTVVFGPSGIVFPSTTIAPISAPSMSAGVVRQTGSAMAATKVVGSSGSSGATATASGSQNGAGTFRRPNLTLSMVCGVIVALGLGIVRSDLT